MVGVYCTWIAIFRGNSTVMKCGWGPSELHAKKKKKGLEGSRKTKEEVTDGVD
jgi:hypothetical protein